MADSFGVIGRNILGSDCYNYKEKQFSRKLFNTEWLTAGEYKHEIANHYRDYKNRKKLRRFNRRGFRTKNVLFEDQFREYREILPVNKIDFPESIPAFSRGDKRPSYRLQSLNIVYNNTLRRIYAANTLKELEYLTKRQERLYNFKKGLKPTQSLSINCSNYSYAAPKSTCIINKQKRHSLGHIRSDALNLTHFQHQLVCKQPTLGIDTKVNNKRVSVLEFSEGEISDDKDNYFLQLAAECYDEGFLAHIKYLESIGERNAINNQISKQRKPRHISEGTNTTSRPQSAGSNVSSSNSVEDLSTSAGVKGFISVVKRILRNRRFVRNPCNYDESAHGIIQHDWKIRVNITRSSSPESLHSSRSSIQEPQDNIGGSNHCIMSDILNTNDEAQPQQTSANNESSSVKRQHFHDLIENLSNLEISELGSLPKIVLTDFSTTNVVADSTTPPLRAKPHENIISKQQSLDVDITSLSDYNSEARPP